jgi:hypothetical protein
MRTDLSDPGRESTICVAVTNPYAPPAAEVTDPPLWLAPAGAVRKPVSVTLMQVTALVVAAVVCIGFVRVGIRLFDGSVLPAARTSLGIQLSLRIAALAWLAWLLWLIRRRSNRARLVGALTLATLAIPAVIMVVRSQSGDGAYNLGWYSVPVINVGLIAWWIHGVAFSDKARRYFSPKASP